MGIFGSNEEIQSLRELIDSQGKLIDVLIKRMDLIDKTQDNIQSEIMTMALTAIQHKGVLLFVISQMSFNDKALKQLSTLLKEPSKNKKK